MAGRLRLVVGLGLDDQPGRLADAHDVADQRLRDRHDIAAVEAVAHRCASAARTASSCSRTRTSAVPPCDTFDSSQPEPRQQLA